MIEQWLEQFCSAWKNKDIAGVLRLFADNVLYYESPHIKYQNKADIKKEWQAILGQDSISIQAKRVATEARLHTVQWELSYVKGGLAHRWDGLYLIQLNKSGECEYFYQVGEEKR